MNLFRNLKLQLILFLTFSFFLIFRPFEGFFVQYVTSIRHYPLEKIVDDIFPIWTYSFPFCVILFGVLSEWEYFGHKWVIFLGNISSQLMTIFTFIPLYYPQRMNSIFLSLSQVFYSFFFASHTSFFGLRYHVFPKSKIHLITSLVRGTMLFGHVISALIGQLFYSFFVNDGFGMFRKSQELSNFGLKMLPMLDYVFTYPCLVISFVFPAHSMYRRKAKVGELRDKNFFLSLLYYYDDDEEEEEEEIDVKVADNEENNEEELEEIENWMNYIYPSSSSKKKKRICFDEETVMSKRTCLWNCAKFFQHLFVSVFKNYFCNFKVFFWSVFVIGSTSIHSLVLTYYQPLFAELDDEINYNGIAIAVMHTSAAIFSLFPIFLKNILNIYDELIVIALVPFLGVFLVLMGLLQRIICCNDFLRILIAYSLLCMYHSLYEFLNTCSFAQIAVNVKSKRFTSIFAMNACLQVPLQVILSLTMKKGSQIFVSLGVILLVLDYVLLLSSVIHRLFKWIVCRNIENGNTIENSIVGKEKVINN